MPEHSSPRVYVSGRSRRRLVPPSRASASSLLLPLLIVASALCSCTAAGGERPRDAGADSAAAVPSPPANRASPAPPVDPLADSAAALDRRFQELRSAINREARALGGSAIDRRSPDYATRFDDLRRRTIAAESLRAARDQLRRRIARRPAAARPP